MPIDLNESYTYLEVIYNRNKENFEAMYLLGSLLWDGGKGIIDLVYTIDLLFY
jgi:hypothetical protein